MFSYDVLDADIDISQLRISTTCEGAYFAVHKWNFL